MTEKETIAIGVGAVVFRGDDVLVIKRGKPPFEGHWSIPGGGLDYGESLRDAVHREVREETGLEIEIISLLDVFEAMPEEYAGEFHRHTVLIDYVAAWVSGEPVAGDDAAEAEFVPIETAIARLSWDLTRQAVRRAAAIHANAGKRS
jgi:8-oxo-dGTP diphosphatase